LVLVLLLPALELLPELQPVLVLLLPALELLPELQPVLLLLPLSCGILCNPNLLSRQMLLFRHDKLRRICRQHGQPL
jgi:hypothetical protein